MEAHDAVAPGAACLGVARADHLAVALPFEEVDDPAARLWIDRNHFPRAALLEAALRFVARDLARPTGASSPR